MFPNFCVSIFFFTYNFRVEGDFPSVEGTSRKLIDVGFMYKYGVKEIFEDSYKCAKKLGLLK